MIHIHTHTHIHTYTHTHIHTHTRTHTYIHTYIHIKANKSSRQYVQQDYSMSNMTSDYTRLTNAKIKEEEIEFDIDEELQQYMVK